MPPLVAIHVRDAQLRHALSQLSAQLRDMTNVMRALSETMVDASARAFERKADPFTGALWKPLSQGRNNQREKKGRSVENILQDSGLLVGSITHSGSRGSVREVSTEYALVGTDIVYAAIRQRGGKTAPHKITARRGKALAIPGIGFRRSVMHPGSVIPARPFLGVGLKDIEVMRGIVRRHFVQALEGKA